RSRQNNHQRCTRSINAQNELRNRCTALRIYSVSGYNFLEFLTRSGAPLATGIWPIMTQYWPNAGCQWRSRTRQKFQKVIAAYAIYTKRCTPVPEFVLGVNRPCAPLRHWQPAFGQYWVMIGCWVQIVDRSDLVLMPDRQASRILGRRRAGRASRP
ncbi:hypothetical protein T265_13822, partial [Opisthorchis viverrini]